MRQYPIRHSCGHVSEKLFMEKASVAERKAAWMGKQPCSKCYYAANPQTPAAIVDFGVQDDNAGLARIYVINSFEIREQFSSVILDESGRETKRRREGWTFQKNVSLPQPSSDKREGKSKAAWMYEGTGDTIQAEMAWLATIGVRIEQTVI